MEITYRRMEGERSHREIERALEDEMAEHKDKDWARELARDEEERNRRREEERAVESRRQARALEEEGLREEADCVWKERLSKMEEVWLERLAASEAERRRLREKAEPTEWQGGRNVERRERHREAVCHGVQKVLLAFHLKLLLTRTLHFWRSFARDNVRRTALAAEREVVQLRALARGKASASRERNRRRKGLEAAEIALGRAEGLERMAESFQRWVSYAERRMLTSPLEAGLEHARVEALGVVEARERVSVLRITAALACTRQATFACSALAHWRLASGKAWAEKERKNWEKEQERNRVLFDALSSEGDAARKGVEAEKMLLEQGHAAIDAILKGRILGLRDELNQMAARKPVGKLDPAQRDASKNGSKRLRRA